MTAIGVAWRKASSKHIWCCLALLMFTTMTMNPAGGPEPAFPTDLDGSGNHSTHEQPRVQSGMIRTWRADDDPGVASAEGLVRPGAQPTVLKGVLVAAGVIAAASAAGKGAGASGGAGTVFDVIGRSLMPVALMAEDEDVLKKLDDDELTLLKAALDFLTEVSDLISAPA